MESTDKLVAATLASGLIAAGSTRIGESTAAESAAMVYFDCLEAIRCERQHRRQSFMDAKGGVSQRVA
jgi:hypothetical protein